MTSRRRSILIVDDDPTARKAAIELVEQLGLGVEAAGADALRRLEATRFVAVLVDGDAPEPGGPGLIRSLRALEGDGTRTPVLAVVADDAARDRCLAAGADEHLARPLERAALAACIERHVPPAAILDEAMVVVLRRLKLVTQLYPAFLAALPEQEAALRTAIAAGDRGEIRQLAHRLRGSAAQMGATALAQALQAIEGVAKSAGGEAIAAPGDEFTALITATIAALSRELEAVR